MSLCLYDVTTLYFEAENEDPDAGGVTGLRKVGYSKERRVDPQVVVGLPVDRRGFPLEIGCFEGSKAETATILPIIKQFQDRHGSGRHGRGRRCRDVVRGQPQRARRRRVAVLAGLRVTKAPIDLASRFRWHGDAFDDGQLIDTITPKNRKVVENDPMHKAEPVWDPEEHSLPESCGVRPRRTRLSAAADRTRHRSGIRLRASA